MQVAKTIQFPLLSLLFLVSFIIIFFCFPAFINKWDICVFVSLSLAHLIYCFLSSFSNTCNCSPETLSFLCISYPTLLFFHLRQSRNQLQFCNPFICVSLKCLHSILCIFPFVLFSPTPITIAFPLPSIQSVPAKIIGDIFFFN